MSNRKKEDQQAAARLKRRPHGMQAYINAVHKEMAEGQPYPGASVEDRGRLAAMDASLVYDEKIMNTRCNR